MPISSSAGSPVAPAVRPAPSAAAMLLGVLRSGSAPRAARVRAAVQSDAAVARRQRERREQTRNDQAGAPTGAELVKASERNIEPGSRAFQRSQARNQQVEQVRADRDAFQQAMNQARQTGAGGGTPRSATPPPDEPGEPSRAHNRSAKSVSEATEPKPGPRPPSQPPRASAPTTGRVAHAGNADANARAVAPMRPAQPAIAAPTPVAAGGRAAAMQAVRGPASQSVQPATPRGGASPAASRSDARPPVLDPADRTRAAARSPRTKAARSGKGAESTDQAQRVRQMVRVLRHNLGRGLTRIVLQLAPRELGKLRLEAELERDTLRLRVQTGTRMAHRLLKHDEATLRASLAAAGIRLEHMEVHPPQLPDARPDLPGREHGGDAGGQGHPDAADAGEQGGGDVADDGGAAGEDAGATGRAHGRDGRSPRAGASHVVRLEAGRSDASASLAAEPRLDVVA